MNALMVALCLTAIASLIASASTTQHVWCAKSKDVPQDPPNVGCQNFTFDKSYRDHLDYAASAINYCEFYGAFVFYEEENFQVFNVM